MALIVNGGKDHSYYPRIKVHKENNTIIIFDSCVKGIVLDPGNMVVFDPGINNYKDYEGVLTLENRWKHRR